MQTQQWVSLPGFPFKGTLGLRSLGVFALALGALQAGAILSASATFHSVYNFYSGPGGACPNGKALLITPNLIYGTTYFGGTTNNGIVFQLTWDSNTGTYSEAVLYSFKGGDDGGNPAAGLKMDATGALYGTATTSNGKPAGVAFQLVPGGPNGSWNYSVIHSFGTGTDGANPNSDLEFGQSGNLFGTTVAGGADGRGTVFELIKPAAPGGHWSEKVINSFSGPTDGAEPYAGLTADASFNIYGTAYAGGTYNAGTVFELSPPTKNNPNWTETTLYNFHGGLDGRHPLGGLTLTSAGAILGTTYNGGTGQDGVIFQLTPNDAGYAESVVIAFDGTNGANPSDALVPVPGGGYYGSTGGAQAGLGGNVFELTPSGNAAHPYYLSVLYTFSGGQDGQAVLPSIAQGLNGTLFGTTFYGGQGGAGSVFQIQ